MIHSLCFIEETGMRVVSECMFAVRITGGLLVSIATIRVIEQLKLAYIC